MKIIISFLLTLLLSIPIFSQKNTFDKYDVIRDYNYKKGKYGLSTYNGKKIISPKYDFLSYFPDKLIALASRKNKWYFIYFPDKHKKQIPYDNVKYFNDDLFIASKDGKYGLINKSAKEIISPSFDFIEDPDNGLAITKLYDLYGLLDLNGNIVSPPAYDQIWILKTNVFTTKINDKYGLFSSEGKEIISPTYNSISILDDNSYLIATDSKYGVLNTNGIVSVSPQFDEIKVFNDQLYQIRFEDKYGLINKNGKEFVPPLYSNLRYDSKDKATANLNGVGGTISLTDGKFTKLNPLTSTTIPDARPSYNDHYTIFNHVDVEAEYPGGINVLRQFVASHIDYPIQAVDKGTQGRVLTQFVVEKDGSISNIKIVKDIGDGCGNEVIRVLKLTKKWKPAMVNGQPVRSNYRFPVNFRLAD